MNLTGDIQERLAAWLTPEPQRWCFCEGKLTVEDSAADGYARVQFQLPAGATCVQWFVGESDLFPMLREKKAADGVFMLQLPDGTWEAHIIECKKTVGPKTWSRAREQMRWSLARLNALSGVLGFKISRVRTYTAYRVETLSPGSSPFSTNFKVGVGPGIGNTGENAGLSTLHLEWHEGAIALEGLSGRVAHQAIPLDIGTGSGQWTLEAHNDQAAQGVT